MPTSPLAETSSWVALLRTFIGTGREDFRLRALQACEDERVRALIAADCDEGFEGFVDAAAKTGARLMAEGRTEEAAIVRVWAAVPGGRALKEANHRIPAAKEVLVPLCEATLRTAAAVGFRESMAFFLTALGNAARVTGDAADAQKYLKAGLKELRALAQEDPAWYGHSLAEALHITGKLHVSQGDLLVAKAVFENAASLYRAGDNTTSDRHRATLAALSLDFGNLHDLLGDRSSAAQAYELSMRTLEGLVAANPERDEPLLAGALSNRAGLHLDAEELARARDLFAKALLLWERCAARNADHYGPYVAKTRQLLRDVESALGAAPRNQESEHHAIQALAAGIFAAARAAAEPAQRLSVASSDQQRRWLIAAYESLSFYLVLATRMAQALNPAIAQKVANAVARAVLPGIATRFFGRNPPDVQQQMLDAFLAGHHRAEAEYSQCKNILPTDGDLESDSLMTDSLFLRFSNKLLAISGAEHAREARQGLLNEIFASFQGTQGAGQVWLLVRTACDALSTAEDR